MVICQSFWCFLNWYFWFTIFKEHRFMAYFMATQPQASHRFGPIIPSSHHVRCDLTPGPCSWEILDFCIQPGAEAAILWPLGFLVVRQGWMRLGTWKQGEVDVFWECPDEDFQLIGRISTPQMGVSQVQRWSVVGLQSSLAQNQHKKEVGSGRELAYPISKILL